MAPTKSAGRVSIRVLPDSTRFKEDLRKALERIEKSVKAEIPVHLKLGREQIAAIREELKRAVFQIKPNIELGLSQEKVERVKRQVEAMKPEVKASMNLNTRAAAARIATLTRPRTIPVFVNVVGMNFAKHLAALGGLGFITEEVKRGLQYLREIDKNAVILARQATLFGSIIATVGSATQGVLALGDGIIKTTGLLLVAPALLSSISIAAAVFIVALKDMGEVFADLKPQFSELRDQMSSNFWAEAEKPIRLLARDLFPTMAEQINESSRAMGYFTGQMAASYRAHVTPEKLATMWGRVNESMWTVTKAVEPIMEAFTILGMHGTKYLNRLSISIVKLAEDFRHFLAVNEDNGNLEKWTEDAIQSFKDLGGIIKGTWNVFGALNQAAKEAGGPTLATMHRNLDDLARMMESPGFQKALVHTFRGMNDATREILAGIGEMGRGYGKLAPIVEDAFGSVGRTIRTLLGYFGDIMAHPIFGKGLKDLFSGIEKGVAALKPAVEPTAVALGSLMTLIGHILERMGGLIGLIMEKWGPALQRLSDEFDGLVDPIFDFVEVLVEEWTPGIETLIDKGLIPLIGWLRDELLPTLTDFIRDKGPQMEQFFDNVTRLIVVALPFLSNAVEFFLLMAGAVMAVVTALMKMGEWLDPNTSPIVTLGKQVGAHIGTSIWYLERFGAAFKTLAEEKVREALDKIIELLWGFELMFSNSWDTNKAVFVDNLNEMGIETDSFSSFVKSVWDLMFGDLIQLIATKGLEMKTGLKLWLDNMGVDTSTTWSTINTTAGVAWGNIRNTVTNAADGTRMNVGQKFGMMLQEAGRTFDTMRWVLNQKVSEVGRGVQDGFQRMVGFIRGIPGTIQAIFSLDWSQIGRNIIGGIADGIQQMAENAARAARHVMQRIRDQLPSSPAKEGPFSGKGWTPYSGIALVDGFAQGMESRINNTLKVSRKLTKGVADELNGIQAQAAFDVQNGEAQETSGGNVTVKVYNPVAEPTSRTIARASSLIKLGGKPE